MKVLGKFIILAVLFALFLRLYNLPFTTRFTRDESSNLNDMHRIFRDRDLTLLGPVDHLATLYHPSLSFYMLMPFAVFGSFTPQSPAYGAVFYGLLTILVLSLLIKKQNKNFWLLAFLFAIIWAPLIIASRWAWNPYLVPFVQGLALLVYFQKWKFKNILVGFLFGLSFHVHFFAIVSFVGFGVSLFIEDLLKRNLKRSFGLGFGFALAIIPFIIFDLKNPPGLFFGKFLHENIVKTGVSDQSESVLIEFLRNLFAILKSLGGGLWGGVLLAISFLALLFSDLKNRKFAPFLFLIPVLLQIFFINFLPSYEIRYFYLCLSFFWLWLFFERPKQTKKYLFLALVVMTVSSFAQMRTILTKPPIEPGAYVVDRASKYINLRIKTYDIKNANIAVLASPDPDPFGQIYRHVLDMEGIKFKLENEYEITDNLFVVSNSSEEVVRKDAANIMNPFRTGPLADYYEIKNSDWKVYLFNRY